MNSHQLDARKGVTKVAQPGKNQPIKPKSTQVPPEKKLPPPRNDRSLKSKPASMTDCIEELESDDDMLSGRIHMSCYTTVLVIVFYCMQKLKPRAL